jgi:hypothetical protein
MSQALNEPRSSCTSHSAFVEAWLDCGQYGRVMLSRVTPKSVVAKDVHEIPPCFADLVVTVDGDRIRNRVRLPSGFTKGRRVARAVSVDDAAPF